MLPATTAHASFSIAEKALATVQGHALLPPSPYSILQLSPVPPNSEQILPVPHAQLRLIKQLPPGISDSYLFDLFRPYGPISSISVQSSFGPDIGLVEYWDEDDAKLAEAELHCADIGGVNISVQLYQPRRAGPMRTDLNVAAMPFVPSSAAYSPASPPSRPPAQGVSTFFELAFKSSGSSLALQYGYPASPLSSQTTLFHHGTFIIVLFLHL